MKKLTSSDRKVLIRLAHSMPKGSPDRRAILSGLKKVAAGKWRLYVAKIRSPGEEMSGQPVLLMEGSQVDLQAFNDLTEELFQISSEGVGADGAYQYQGMRHKLRTKAKKFLGDPEGARREFERLMKGKTAKDGWLPIELPPESDRLPLDDADYDNWPTNPSPYETYIVNWPTDDAGLPLTL